MSTEKIETLNKVSIRGQVVFIKPETKGYIQVVAQDEGTGQYPTVMAFDFKSEKLKYTPEVGDTVEMTGFVTSGEYKGRYYTNVRGGFCRNLSKSGGKGVSAKHTQPPEKEESFEDDFEDAPF